MRWEPKHRGWRSRGVKPRPLQPSPDFARMCLLPLKEEFEARLPPKPRIGRIIARRPQTILPLGKRRELLLRLKGGGLPHATLQDARELLKLAVLVLNRVQGGELGECTKRLKAAVAKLRRALTSPNSGMYGRYACASKFAPAKVAPRPDMQRAVAGVVLHLHGVIEHLHIEKGANVTFVIAGPDAADAGKDGGDDVKKHKKTRGPGMGGLMKRTGIADCPYAFESHECIRFLPLGKSYLFKRTQVAACEIVNRLTFGMKNVKDWYVEFTDMDAKILRSANPNFLEDCVSRKPCADGAKQGNRRWSEFARLRQTPEEGSV